MLLETAAASALWLGSAVNGYYLVITSPGPAALRRENISRPTPAFISAPADSAMRFCRNSGFEYF